MMMKKQRARAGGNVYVPRRGKNGASCAFFGRNRSAKRSAFGPAFCFCGCFERETVFSFFSTQARETPGA